MIYFRKTLGNRNMNCIMMSIPIPASPSPFLDDQNSLVLAGSRLEDDCRQANSGRYSGRPDLVSSMQQEDGFSALHDLGSRFNQDGTPPLLKSLDRDACREDFFVINPKWRELGRLWWGALEGFGGLAMGCHGDDTANYLKSLLGCCSPPICCCSLPPSFVIVPWRHPAPASSCVWPLLWHWRLAV